jgi:hypothetical protein
LKVRLRSLTQKDFQLIQKSIREVQWAREPKFNGIA